MTQDTVTTPADVDLARTASSPWTPRDAAELYRVEDWGQGYFGVNEEGHVEVRPEADPQQAFDLKLLVDELRARGLNPPYLLRFSDILRHRLGRIAGTFRNAIEEMGYRGEYRAVYPIKVNQQAQVVEEVLSYGSEHGFGLEAGSKPELLAIMAMVKDEQTPIICNGFKDDRFIEAVILARKLGRNVIPVVEKFSELPLIAKHARAHDIRPSIGLRVKLAAAGAGRWEQSGGERSKFGLFVSEVLDAVQYLKDADMLDCLELLHFHLGSQINDIRSVKNAVSEQARIYTELVGLGAGLKYLDIGGGLGVDYDGSKTSITGSMNYAMQEYANDVVYHTMEVCDAAGVDHPTIISESGRAMVAYHSVLVFNVMGWSGFDRFELPEDLSREKLKDHSAPLRTLAEAYASLTPENYIECYHDAQLAREQVLNIFRLGYCSLSERGLAERIFYAVCSRVREIVRKLPEVPEEFDALEHLLCDTYFCNVSFFQSLPDAWAIDQLFPIMPIHRLDERPTCRGTLADITCDSDGKIDRFIASGDTAAASGSKDKRVLELHPYRGGSYDLAAFLVGAYQEILGDLHNLFGDTHAVHVKLDADGTPTIEEVVEGDTVDEVLRYVQFNPDWLKRHFRQALERALKHRRITLDESRFLADFYDRGLAGYTYLT